MLIAALAIIGLTSKPTAERQKGKNAFYACSRLHLRRVRVVTDLTKMYKQHAYAC